MRIRKLSAVRSPRRIGRTSPRRVATTRSAAGTRSPSVRSAANSSRGSSSRNTASATGSAGEDQIATSHDVGGGGVPAFRKERSPSSGRPPGPGPPRGQRARFAVATRARGCHQLLSPLEQSQVTLDALLAFEPSRPAGRVLARPPRQGPAGGTRRCSASWRAPRTVFSTLARSRFEALPLGGEIEQPLQGDGKLRPAGHAARRDEILLDRLRRLALRRRERARRSESI